MCGKFIVIEGLEGSGKTSAINQIKKTLYNYGITNLIITHDPGGTPLSKILRQFLKHGLDNEILSTKAELLMFYAARVQLLETIIKPSLSDGSWVVLDRYDLSSQAYQGAGRKVDRKILKVLSNFVLEGFQPDLTFYLDVSPVIGLARVNQRGVMDRFETESVDFFERVRNYYKIVANANKDIITINANRALHQVHSDINHYLQTWLCMDKV